MSCPIHEGPLQISKRKGKEMRYFVLYRDHLEYYLTEEQAKGVEWPRGRVAIEEVRRLEVVGKDGFVLHLDSQEVPLSVLRRPDLQLWLDALRKAITLWSLRTSLKGARKQAEKPTAAADSLSEVVESEDGSFEADISCEGGLSVWRKGELQPRYFVLRQGSLAYYGTAADFRHGGEPRGVLPLNDLASVSPTKDGFSMSFDNLEKPLNLQTSSPEDQQKWLAALGNADASTDAVSVEETSDSDSSAEGSGTDTASSTVATGIEEAGGEVVDAEVASSCAFGEDAERCPRRSLRHDRARSLSPCARSRGIAPAPLAPLTSPRSLRDRRFELESCKQQVESRLRVVQVGKERAQRMQAALSSCARQRSAQAQSVRREKDELRSVRDADEAAYLSKAQSLVRRTRGSSASGPQLGHRRRKEFLCDTHKSRERRLREVQSAVEAQATADKLAADKLTKELAELERSLAEEESDRKGFASLQAFA